MPSLASTPPVPPAERLVFLDWVRILAFGLLVLYHVGMYYVSWPWHVKSVHADPFIEPLLRLSSPWRMSLLFLVSGAATSFMLLRRGATGALLGQRARRVLLPLAAGIVLVVPPQPYFEAVQRFGYDGSFVEFLGLYFSAQGAAASGFCDARGCLILPTWNHLWFLPYLFTYTLLLWAALRARPDLLERLSASVPRLLSGARLLWLPMLAFALVRIALQPRFPVTYALVDDAFAHAQYAGAFVLGAVLARSPSVWPRMESMRWSALALAVGAWAVLVSLPPGASPLPLRAVVHAVVQWGAIVAALGFAHRHCNADGALRRYLTDAVFPVYIFHQTLIVLLAVALAPAALAAPIEAALIVTGTFALSLLGYEGVRRVGWLRPWFGLAPAARPATLSPMSGAAPAPRAHPVRRPRS